MSNLVEHAKREFKRAGYIPLDQDQDDDPNKWIQENVLELLEVFSKQGHSGMSAAFCVGYFEKLAKWGLLTPINSAEELEFNNEVCPNTNQSRVFSAVFQDDIGEYYIEAIVFRNQEGSCFTGNCMDEIGVQSKCYIKYPFVPKKILYRYC